MYSSYTKKKLMRGVSIVGKRESGGGRNVGGEKCDAVVDFFEETDDDNNRELTAPSTSGYSSLMTNKYVTTAL